MNFQPLEDSFDESSRKCIPQVDGDTSLRGSNGNTSPTTHHAPSSGWRYVCGFRIAPLYDTPRTLCSLGVIDESTLTVAKEVFDVSKSDLKVKIAAVTRTIIEIQNMNALYHAGGLNCSSNSHPLQQFPQSSLRSLIDSVSGPIRHPAASANTLGSSTLNYGVIVPSHFWITPKSVRETSESSLALFLEYRPSVSLEHLFEADDPHTGVDLVGGGGNRMAAVPRNKVLMVSTVSMAILHHLLGGLAILHNQGIPHQAVRPSSVLVSCGLQPRWDNIGSLNMRTPLSDPTMWVWYAPEISHNDLVEATTSGRSYTTENASRWMASDMFSFGLLVYSLSTGRRPFESMLQLAKQSPKHFRQSVIQIQGSRSRWSDFFQLGVDGLEERHFHSNDLRQIATLCLKEDPSERPTASALLSKIESFLHPDVVGNHAVNNDDEPPHDGECIVPMREDSNEVPSPIALVEVAGVSLQSNSAGNITVAESDVNVVRIQQCDSNEIATLITQKCFGCLRLQSVERSLPQQQPMSVVLPNDDEPHGRGNPFVSCTSTEGLSANVPAARSGDSIMFHHRAQASVEIASLVAKNVMDIARERRDTFTLRNLRALVQNGCAMDDHESICTFERYSRLFRADHLPLQLPSMSSVSLPSNSWTNEAKRLLLTYFFPCDSPTWDGYSEREEARLHRPYIRKALLVAIILMVAVVVVVSCVAMR